MMMSKMSRMKSKVSSMHAPSNGFSPQEVHVLVFTDSILLFYTRKTTNSAFCFVNRRAVIPLD
jgi:hypothetical protein